MLWRAECAQHAAHAYASRGTPVPGWSETTWFGGGIGGVRGYAAHRGRRVVVSFCGCDDIRDWLQDGRRELVRTPAGGQSRACAGFLAAYLSVRDCLWPAVMLQAAQSRDEGYAPQLTFTGHGLGGALAVLAGACLAADGPHGMGWNVMHFGCPRLGDRVLAETWHGRVQGVRWRQDLAARRPWPWLPVSKYHHVGRIAVCGPWLGRWQDWTALRYVSLAQYLDQSGLSRV